jgi:purine-binding chemotaxis protein CheW
MASLDDSGPDGRPTGKGFDWAAAYQRLDAIRVRLDAADNPSPEAVRRALRQRAAQYARQTAAVTEHEYLDVIAFEIASDRFAIEVDNSRAAIPLAGLTAVPGLPVFYLGLVGHRGGVIPVIDIRGLIGMADRNREDMRFALVIHGKRGTLGLAATQVNGITRFRADEVASAEDESARKRALIGMAPDGTVIIDAERLLQDARLVVDDQPIVFTRNEGDGR